MSQTLLKDSYAQLSMTEVREAKTAFIRENSESELTCSTWLHELAGN